MPIYDFQCTNCNFQSEMLRKMSDPSLATCPNCKKETLAKKLSAPSFQLSGSGWYATDFKDKSSNKKVTEATKSGEETKSSTSCAPGCDCH